MTLSSHPHHASESELFRYHVYRIKGLDVCGGCLANSVFLCLIYPLLGLTFYARFNVYVLGILGALWIGTFLSYWNELITKKWQITQFERIGRNVFLLTAVVSTIATPAKEIFMDYTLLALLLSLPQLLLYAHKIWFQTEFTRKFLKLTIRLLFICSIFLFLLDTSSDFMNLIYLGVIFFLFVKLRSFSSFRVEKGYKVTSTTALVNSIHTQSNHFLLFVLFLVGLIAFVSPHQCSTASIGVLGPPLLIGSIDNPNACPQCGEKVSTDGIYCMNCGHRYGDQQPVDPSQSTGHYFDRRYNNGYNRRYRSRRSRPWYDNNICFYICLFDCCTDCLCSAMADE